MKSGTRISVELQEIFNNKQSVELFNEYKGVPIHTQAVIESIIGPVAVLLARPPESNCLALQTGTLIRHSELAHPIKAKIQNFDIIANRVELANFQEVSTRFVERVQIRVEPRNMVPVHIENGTQRIVGTLSDVSLNGVGVYISTTGYEYALRRSDTVHIAMQLPGGWVYAQGKVKGTGKSVDFCRLSINFSEETPDNLVVQRYIASRREEILVELFNHFDGTASFHPPGSRYEYADQ